MNPKYGKPGGGDWVFKAVRYDGSDGPYYYTVAFKRAQAKQKFERVALFTDKVDGMRKKWIAQLKKFNVEDPKSVCALILELLYTFSARIGSAKNATEGSPTFGISTLLVKHAKLEPNGAITLRYKGKGGIPTVHKLSNSDPIMKIMLKALHELIDEKDVKEPIFTVPSSRGYKRITGQMVNNYFRALGAGDVTVHKLRTLRGTQLFQDLAQKLSDQGKKPKNDTQAKAFLTKMATEVGKELNHVRSTSTGMKVTPATAIANYIDPTAVASVFRDWGFRPPAVVEKLLGTHSE
jgi:DNA topoisomerase IB